MFLFCSYCLPFIDRNVVMQLSLPLEKRPILSRIRARLLAHFGPQRDALRADPLSQLVNGIISTRTRDEISSAAFARLRHRYASWDLLRQASSSEIEDIIRPVTFADRKADHLPRALRKIVARCGSLELDFLADWDDGMAMQWLGGLPGVRAKTAASVLNFSTLRKPVLAVDTHLLRVGARLGLLPPDADYEVGYALFRRRIPNDWDADDLYELHWQMKYLGQRICTRAAPACANCPLRDLCPRHFARHAP
jgi:endonuclease-3